MLLTAGGFIDGEDNVKTDWDAVLAIVRESDTNGVDLESQDTVGQYLVL